MSNDTVSASYFVEHMPPDEREVFLICVQACDEQNQALCDGMVCLHFVEKKLMRIASDGFVISPLGREVAHLLREKGADDEA